MRRVGIIGLLLLLALASCHGPRRQARQMVRRAEQLFDSLPDSTASLIDSVLRMPVYFNEKRRMDMALLQGEALFGDRGQEIPPVMDDEFFDDRPFLTASPELERAGAYYARKEQFGKAAHAALYSGFIQQHYSEKQAAMQSFKDAERYGEEANDSLTMARAQYWMGRMLYDDYTYREALSLFKSADAVLGNHLAEKAMVQNMMAVCHLMLQDHENAEDCLKQSLLLAEQGHINKVKHKALNNYAVLYRLQGKHDDAIKCLRQEEKESNLTDTEKTLLCLNFGNSFAAAGAVDSAFVCYRHLEEMLPCVHIKEENRISAYGALSQFAKKQGNDSLALHYREMHEKLLYEVMRQKQEQNVFRIQQQYDYETIQNALNRKIISRHRIIFIISVLLVVSAIIILLLQFRHKQLRKSEAEMRQQFNAMKQDIQQSVKFSVLDEEIALRLKMMLTAERAKKRTKDHNHEWLSLVSQVMNGKESLFESARATIEVIYPNLFAILMEKFPNLSETEAKVCLLSFCDISNTEIGDLLGLKPNTINQIRSTLRKKMNLNSDKMKEQLRNALTD